MKLNYEPTRRQLCQWYRLVHNRIQSFTILLLGQKLEKETVCLPNLNHITVEERGFCNIFGHMQYTLDSICDIIRTTKMKCL